MSALAPDRRSCAATFMKPELLKRHPTERWSPLSVAVKKSHGDIVKLLLSHTKSELNDLNRYGRTPLAEAAFMGDVEILRMLLEQPEVDVNGRNGHPPLYIAAANGNDDIVRLLLQHHEIKVNDIGLHGRTAIHGAANQGHITITRRLLERGADVNIRDEDGYTPLMLAAIGGHDAVAELLVERGGKIDPNNETFNVVMENVEGKVPSGPRPLLGLVEPYVGV
jgi:ankyrin repeat protein